MTEITEDPERCDHPFNEIELLCAREYSTNTSMAPTVPDCHAIIHCKKCDRYLLLSDNGSWDQQLYHDLIGNKKPIVGYKDRRLCAKGYMCDYHIKNDLNDKQLRLMQTLRPLLNHKEATLGMQMLWKHDPILMQSLLATMTEALVKGTKS